METKIANYRIIIEPEVQDGKKVYNAYCPTLAVADYGDSIEEVLGSIHDGIELAIESLVEEGKEVPVDDVTNQVIAATQAAVPLRA
jgi:predicted RNase H-like HicB family nuclease